MKKTPQERVAEYKAKAAKIERREARKLRAKSPQWRATQLALNALYQARIVIEANDEGSAWDAELLSAISLAIDPLNACWMDQVSP